MPRTRAFPLILLVACAALPVRAQQTVIQIENVRTEYARVLRAEPVYQTLRATAMVEECEDAAPADGGEPRRGLAKVVGAVKDALTPNSDEAEPEAGEPPRSEEHTSELQSLMRISYAVFCLKKKHMKKKHLESTAKGIKPILCTT